MSEKLMQALAAMAERRPLRALYNLCDSQKQVSTGKLREYLDHAGDTLAGYAATLRHEFDRIAIAAPAAPADLPECGCCGRTGECDADCDARQAAPAAPAQAEQEPVVYWILFDATGFVPYIKKSLGDGFLAFFDNEEDAKRAKRKHHGTDYKRVEYFRAPPTHPDAALVEAMQLLEVLRGRIGGALWSLDSEDRELAERTDRAIATLAGKGGE